MSEDAEALVGNAADETQVSNAKKAEKRRRDRELDDVRAVLATREGRRLLWRVMTYCSAFDSVFHENQLRMAHGSGRQDVGHFVMAEINAAKPDAFLTMMQESTKERSNA